MSSGPRAVSDLLTAWARGLTTNEHESLSVLYQAIAEAIRRGQKVPPSIDRRCMALVITKLEEAEHWALQAMRIAVDRCDRERDAPVRICPYSMAACNRRCQSDERCAEGEYRREVNDP